MVDFEVLKEVLLGLGRHLLEVLLIKKGDFHGKIADHVPGIFHIPYLRYFRQDGQNILHQSLPVPECKHVLDYFFGVFHVDTEVEFRDVHSFTHELYRLLRKIREQKVNVLQDLRSLLTGGKKHVLEDTLDTLF